MRLVILALIILTASAGVARAAGNVVDAGPASTYDLDTENVPDFPDIYTRQLAYGEESKKLREQLKERQRNFIAPRSEAYKNYQNNRTAMWGSGNVGNQ